MKLGPKFFSCNKMTITRRTKHLRKRKALILEAPVETHLSSYSKRDVKQISTFRSWFLRLIKSNSFTFLVSSIMLMMIMVMLMIMIILMIMLMIMSMIMPMIMPIIHVFAISFYCSVYMYLFIFSVLFISFLFYLFWGVSHACVTAY